MLLFLLVFFFFLRSVVRLARVCGGYTENFLKILLRQRFKLEKRCKMLEDIKLKIYKPKH